MAIAGLAGGLLLFVLLFSLNMIMNQLIAYDISVFNGICPMDDPVMMLFFTYPFVVAFAAANLYDIVHSPFQGSVMQKGIAFGFTLMPSSPYHRILQCILLWNGRYRFIPGT